MKTVKASHGQLRSFGATLLLALAGVLAPTVDAMTCECTAISKYNDRAINDGVDYYGSCNANKEFKRKVEREYADCSAKDAGADIGWTDTCDPKSPAYGLPWRAGYTVFMFNSKGYYDDEYKRFACPSDPYDKLLDCHGRYDRDNFSKSRGRIVVTCVPKNAPQNPATKDSPESESLVGEGDSAIAGPVTPPDTDDNADRPVTH
jgi:hypothetical protein